MNWKKIFQTIGLNLKGSAPQRAAYLREKKLFGLMGEKVSYSPRKIPLYPNLIRIHNNVSLAAGVQFITHDISDNVINGYLKSAGRDERVSEKIGCIEIMDNVFIGANTTILYDVRIGENCIIGASSTVTKDLEPNGVYAGTPAKRIGSFDEYVQKCAQNPGGGTAIPMLNTIKASLMTRLQELGHSLRIQEAWIVNGAIS